MMMMCVFILTQLHHSADFDVKVHNKIFGSFEEAVEELNADIDFLIDEWSVSIEKDYNNIIENENEYASYILSNNNHSSFQLTIDKYYLKGEPESSYVIMK